MKQLILFIVLFLPACTPKANAGTVETYADMRLTTIAAHARTVGPGGVVLIGDSIVEGFWWHNLCGLRAVNAGMRGITVRTLASRVDDVLRTQDYSISIISVGINNANRQYSFRLSDFQRYYDNIVQQAYMESPHIILMTVRPPQAGWPSRHVLSRIPLMNAHIRAVAQRYNAVLIEQADPGTTVDGLHPDEGMYLQIRGDIENAVRQVREKRGEGCGS